MGLVYNITCHRLIRLVVIFLRIRQYILHFFLRVVSLNPAIKKLIQTTNCTAYVSGSGKPLRHRHPNPREIPYHTSLSKSSPISLPGLRYMTPGMWAAARLMQSLTVRKSAAAGRRSSIPDGFGVWYLNEVQWI